MSDSDQNEETSAVVETPEAADGEFQFVEDPAFDIDYKGECAYEVKVSVAAANEAKQAEEVFGELQHEAELPGFRRGKAPRALLEKKFAKAVRGDVTEKLVTATFRKLIETEDLRPLGMPDIDGLEDALEREEGAPLEFTFKFEVSPKCELGKYRGLEIERPVLKVDDKDVDEAIDELRDRSAVYETYTEGKSKEGDQVVIDFKGAIDGEEFQGGSAENYPYILGSKRFFPEFEKALVGVTAGDEINCEVSFPEDYSAENLQGKTATFDIKIHEVKRKSLPAVDDDFAKENGHDDVAAMRAEVSKNLREGAEQQSNSIAETNAIDQVVANSTFELPKSLIESSANEYFNQEIRRLMSLRVPPADIDARAEDIRKGAEDNAARNIKAFVATNEIGTAEGIEVTEADFEQEAEALHQRYGMDMETVSRFLSQDEQRDEYTSRIFRRKALKVLIDNATITDKEVTREELDEKDVESDDE